MMIELIILILAIPIGFLIAHLTRDELVIGRIWFKLILVVCAVMGVWFYFKGMVYITLTFLFILIVVLVSLIKSYDKSWIK